MSVVTRIIMFINSIMLGFGQGFQPVAAFNYAAGKKDRVYEAFWFSVRVGAVFLSFFALIAGAFAPWIIRVFRDDPQVVQVGAFALRMQSIALPLSAYIVISNMMFQYIGKPEKATVLAVSRQGLVFIPLILILSHLFGLPGIQVSQALADLTTFLIAVILTRGTLRSLKEG
jgi:Na+-driven multidrug efflux pump